MVIPALKVTSTLTLSPTSQVPFSPGPFVISACVTVVTALVPLRPLQVARCVQAAIPIFDVVDAVQELREILRLELPVRQDEGNRLDTRPHPTCTRVCGEATASERAIGNENRARTGAGVHRELLQRGRIPPHEVLVHSGAHPGRVDIQLAIVAPRQSSTTLRSGIAVQSTSLPLRLLQGRCLKVWNDVAHSIMPDLIARSGGRSELPLLALLLANPYASLDRLQIWVPTMDILRGIVLTKIALELLQFSDAFLAPNMFPTAKQRT